MLADHETLIAILGERGEDPGLRGARVREEIFDARVLQRLEQQHPAGAGNGLSHRLPRCQTLLNLRARSQGPAAGPPAPPGGTGEDGRCSLPPFRRWSSSATTR